MGGSSTQPRPLVVLVCAVPLLRAAIEDELGWMCDVQHYPPGRGEATARFLALIRPDGVVFVDGDDDLAGGEAYAREAGIPLVHLEVSRRRIRRLSGDGWAELPVDGDSAPAIGDVLATEFAGLRRR